MEAGSARRALPSRKPVFPAQDALEQFGIPFICYGPDGRRIYVSAAAAKLLESRVNGEAIADQADQLTFRLLVQARAPGSSQPLNDEIPGIGGSCSLRFQWLGHTSRAAAVVVLLPQSSAPSTNPCLSAAGLTERELQVARLIAAGRASKEIAAVLRISTHTARRHTEHVFAKLSVRSRAAVATLVSGNGRVAGVHDHGTA